MMTASASRRSATTSCLRMSSAVLDVSLITLVAGVYLYGLSKVLYAWWLIVKDEDEEI